MSRIVKSDRIVINADKKFSSNSVGLNSVGGRARSHADDESVDANYSGLIKAARRQAEGIIKSARDNAERITREAQISAAEVMETARKEGHTDGYADGYDKGYAKGVSEGQDHGMAQYRDIIQEAMELKQNYLDDYENLYRASERHMLGLSIEIARKVIGGVLENDDRACVELAYNALKQMRGNGKASLRVGEGDYPKILENKGLLLSKLDGIEEIDIVEDTGLEGGSYVVDTGSGIIDGSVDAQMEVIESALLKSEDSIL